ncbi:hypothetical protein IJD44_01745 [bacterium]|nr:hypothetical protein [bacterium]
MKEYLQIQNGNIFSMFPNYSLEQTNTAEKNVNKAKTTNLLTQELNNDSFENTNVEEKKKRRRKILFGSTLASVIFTAGTVSLFLLKGFHGSSFNKLSRFTEKLATDMSLQGKKPKDIVSKTSYYARKGVKKSVDSLEATSNFTALKDFISNKILKTNKVTGKFADVSTEKFKGVVDKTLGKQYDKAEIKVKNLTSLLKHFNAERVGKLSEKDLAQSIKIKGETKTLGEWLNLLSTQTQRLETEFDKNFAMGARRARDSKRMSLLSDLPQKIQERFFKNKKSLFNPENYKTYATQDLTKGAQTELRNEILAAKKQITNNISDIHDTMRGSLASFSKTIKPEDDVAKQSVQSLKQLFEKFKNCSGAKEVTDRQKITKEISSTIDSLLSTTEISGLYSEKEQAEIIKYLLSIKNTALSTGAGSKGSIEEIMTILNGLEKSKIKTAGEEFITKSQLKEFGKFSSKISKSLNKAADLEANEYFLKQAEMKVGSAPTDVLSVLFPIGVGAYTIAAGDNKDERISATLTTCIPLVGTFATMVYGTTKMFSGVKNLAFAGISGLVLKLIGNGCDALYKKYKKSGSVATVFKDEYDKIFIDFEDKTEETKKTK